MQMFVFLFLFFGFFVCFFFFFGLFEISKYCGNIHSLYPKQCVPIGPCTHIPSHFRQWCESTKANVRRRRRESVQTRRRSAKMRSQYWDLVEGKRAILLFFLCLRNFAALLPSQLIIRTLAIATSHFRHRNFAIPIYMYRYVFVELNWRLRKKTIF